MAVKDRWSLNRSGRKYRLDYTLKIQTVNLMRHNVIQCTLSYVGNEGPDQPPPLSSLIRVVIVHYQKLMDSVEYMCILMDQEWLDHTAQMCRLISGSELFAYVMHRLITALFVHIEKTYSHEYAGFFLFVFLGKD